MKTTAFALLSLAFGPALVASVFSNISQYNAMPPILIKIRVSGSVGSQVPLSVGSDWIPSSTYRSMIAGFLNPPSGYWESKIKSQLKLSRYQMINRYLTWPYRKQLVLAPESVWNITVNTDSLKVTTNSGLDFVSVSYDIDTYLIARRGSVEEVEKSLTKTKGSWNEFYSLPLDPEFFFQKTGYACVDESGLGFDYVNSLNAWQYFNSDCKKSKISTACHGDREVNQSCSQSMRKSTGIASVSVRWTRVEYDENIAKIYRVGPSSFPERNLENLDPKDVQVFYKYFPDDDCRLTVSKCIKKAGWRRLLTFTTTALNTGFARFLHVARLDRDGTAGIFIGNGTFVADKCLRQFKLQDFAKFKFGGFESSAAATCIGDTWRYHNHEYSPIGTSYNECRYQGVSSGWGYSIAAGAPCQWIDITDINDNQSRDLISTINPEGVICEGLADHTPRPKRPIFIPINSTTSLGVVPNCLRSANWFDDNTSKVRFRANSRKTTVTSKCPRGSRPYSQWRDCGWTVISEARACVPGSQQTLSVKILPVDGKAMTTTAFRVCESSRALGYVSTRCDFVSAIAHGLVRVNETASITFECPKTRGAVEGGLFSILAAKYATWEVLDETVPKLQILT